MKPLGLWGQAGVINLVDALALGVGGIHLVVTDRAEAVRTELEARLPKGWTLAPVFAADRDRLSPEAYATSIEKPVLLVDVIDATQPEAELATRALNTDREWLLRRGKTTVLIVPGETAETADTNHLALQQHAPDFWSVRSRVHRIAGKDSDGLVHDQLVELCKPRFGKDRAKAVRWIDARPWKEDWTTYRLWRAGPERQAWLQLATPKLPTRFDRIHFGRTKVLPSLARPVVGWSPDPVGDPIAPERWPMPTWPSGQLTANQQVLVQAIGAAIDRDGEATVHLLEEDTPSDVSTAVWTFGLLRADRYDAVVVVDGTNGVESSIREVLRKAGDSAVMPGLIQAARRLSGALGSARALVLLSNVDRTEHNLLRAIWRRHARVFTVRPSAWTTFAIAASQTPDTQTVMPVLFRQLSRWPRSAVVTPIHPDTIALDLRHALAVAEHTVLLADDTWQVFAEEVWTPVRTAGERVVGLAFHNAGPPPALASLTWLSAMNLKNGSEDKRLEEQARRLAGAPQPSPAIAPILPFFEEDVDGDVSEPRSESGHSHATSHQEIDQLRTQAEQDSATFFPEYPKALHRQAIRAESEYNVIRALDLSQTALQYCETFIPNHSKEVRPYLSQAHHDVGTYFLDTEQYESALNHATEAVALRRKLVKQAPKKFFPRLADSLHLAAFVLRETKDLSNAVASRRKAVQIEREFAKRHPKRFLSSFADGLGFLGEDLHRLGQPQNALNVTEAAVRIFRRLTEEKSEIYLAGLAWNLSQLGDRLEAMGRKEAALHAIKEAVEGLRHLAQFDPSEFELELAGSLVQLSGALGDLGRWNEARITAQEAMQRLRTLHDETPRPVVIGALANSLLMLGTSHHHLGKMEDALEATQEAVTLCRTLSGPSEENLELLADSLFSLGSLLLKLQRWSTAVEIMQENVRIQRRLTAQNAETSRLDLAEALDVLVKAQQKAGGFHDARETAKESLSFYCQLVKDHPDAFVDHFLESFEQYKKLLQVNQVTAKNDPTFRKARKLGRQLGILNRHGLVISR